MNKVNEKNFGEHNSNKVPEKRFGEQEKEQSSPNVVLDNILDCFLRFPKCNFREHFGEHSGSLGEHGMCYEFMTSL